MRAYQITKSVCDRLVAIAIAIATFPIWVVCGLMVYAMDGGPVLYRGVRIGKGGHPIRMCKFRTMVKNADKLGGATTASNDPRLLPFGRTFRIMKIDELPQLINIIAGDMSFVGPRPEVPSYVEKYTDEEARCLTVLPGVTDFASLAYYDLQTAVGEGDADEVYFNEVFRQKNQLRLKYVDERGIWTDIKIFHLTLFRVARAILSVMIRPLRSSSRRRRNAAPETLQPPTSPNVYADRSRDRNQSAQCPDPRANTRDH
jgi:lipopolysaccharide/colanic/teichoic acid biosynthesis glycosyltransferase